MSDVTQSLNAIAVGEPKAADHLLPLVYEELRKLAVVRMANEKAGPTLQSTALVQEAWLKIAGEGKEHFRRDDRAEDCRRPRPGTAHDGSTLGLRAGLVEAHHPDVPFQLGESVLKNSANPVACLAGESRLSEWVSPSSPNHALNHDRTGNLP